MVVSVIITLALIAIPSYNKSKLKAIQREGLVNLKLLAAAERIYRMENEVYTKCFCPDASTCSGATGCNLLLHLNLNLINWRYVCDDSAGNGGITAWAISQVGTCTYTLNDADFDTKDYSSKTASCI